MKVTSIDSLDNFSGTVLIPVFETTVNNVIPIQFDGLEISSKVFFGKKDTHYLVDKNDKTYIFIGLGEAIDYKSLKDIFRRVASKQKDTLTQDVSLFLPDVFTDEQVEAVISGLYLGTYNLGHFKKQEIHPFLDPDFELKMVASKDYLDVISKAIKIAKAQLETFTLVDLPSNTVTPKYLAKWAQEKGKQFGFDVKVIGLEEAKKQNLGAFVAVGKGSDNEAQFVIMDYTPKNPELTLKHIGLVGKGITFDTGGLDIKTAGMVHMKCDMAGGAAVFGAMQLIADLQLPVKVTAIVPCAENAVDSKSFAPSDVIYSYSGNSIEVTNTDAEGRLVLADGISYLIKNYNPEYLIDIATLTGSSVATLGYEAGALFTNNELMTKNLQQIGESIGERLWPLPLWECYQKDIESEIADVKNFSGKPVAGAISAAKFLEFFTNEHKAWAHLDIAGVAFVDDEFAKTKHSNAFGVHLLTKFIENL